MNFAIKHIELKIIYTLLFAFLATQTRFLVVYWEQLGVSDTRIGILASSQRAISMLATPIWGALSDRIGDRKRVLVLTMSICAVVFPLQVVFDYQWLVQGRDVYTYLWIFVMLHSLFSCAMATLWDALVLVHLKNDNLTYGNQRLFGAISWGLTYIGLGALIDIWGARVILPMSILTAVPLIHFIMKSLPDEVDTGYSGMVDKALEKEPELGERKEQARETNEGNSGESESESSVEVEIPHSEPSGHQEESTDITAESPKRQQRAGRKVTLSNVCNIIFHSRSSVTFFLVQFVLGGGMSVVESMLFIYLKKKFSATGFLMGLSVGMTVLFELPIFHWTESLILRLGCPMMLILGQLAFVVRVFGYTIVPSPVWILFLEPLHGITFGLVQSASVLLVQQLADPALVSTSQALTTAFRMGAGPMVFLLFSGYEMDNYGGDSMFIACGFAVVMSTVAYAYVWRNDNIKQERTIYRHVVELQNQDSSERPR